MKPAVIVDGISKFYHLGGLQRADRNLTENVLYHLKRSMQTLTGRTTLDEANGFWALKNTSFEVQPGEVIGLVGRNGAGKSTLLKILSRITEPTSGKALIRGRLGSLLEVGTGFHHELSGRENIFLNGSILGMSRREIKSKLDEIIAFADMDQFLDTPVKRYSSGMVVRLAFAIAAHLQPEVLIVDEVLAVGDAQFQKKCLGKMKDVSQEGRTILFVSHDMHAVRRLCHRAVLLSKGEVVQVGPTAEVIATYLAREAVVVPPGQQVDLSNTRRKGLLTARFTSMTMDNGAGDLVHSGGPLRVQLTIHADQPIVTDSIALTIIDRTGFRLIHADTARIDYPVQLQPGTNQVELTIPALHLQPGGYTMGLWLAQWPDHIIDQVESACDLEVIPNPDDSSVKPVADGAVRCDLQARVVVPQEI
ncbi:MAG: ABC transporter ATP-binding protein [Zavarzinella sp.]